LTEFTFRPATRADARTIAELFSIASDGVSDYIWSKDAGPRDDLLDVGQQRYELEDSNFGFRNATMVCAGTEIVGMLLAFPMQIDEEYVESDPVLAPMAKLEEPDSYYICAMAVFPQYRGMGIGSRLLDRAEEKCRSHELNKLSLIVFDENIGARRLYERSGFVEANRDEIVPHPLIRMTGNALLMVRHLLPAGDQ